MQRGHLPPLLEVVQFQEYYQGLPLLPIPDLLTSVVGHRDAVQLERLDSLISHHNFFLCRLRAIQHYWVTIQRAENRQLTANQHQAFILWCRHRNIRPPAPLPMPIIEHPYADLLAPEPIVIDLLTDSDADNESESEEMPILVHPEDMLVN